MNSIAQRLEQLVGGLDVSYEDFMLYHSAPKLLAIAEELRQRMIPLVGTCVCQIGSPLRSCVLCRSKDIIDTADGLGIAVKNRKQDLWLEDENNCYFIPQGWCDDWSVAQGFSGGLDFIDDEGLPSPEIYCYAPTHTTPNSPVDTLFVSVKDLSQLTEITEEKAKKKHPALGEHLDKINEEKSK